MKAAERIAKTTQNTSGDFAVGAIKGGLWI
jgi:hypothetical protein